MATISLDQLSPAEDASWAGVLLALVLEDPPGFSYDWTAYPDAQPPTSRIIIRLDGSAGEVAAKLERFVAAANTIAGQDPLSTRAEVSVAAAGIE
jgi:hypothetical protein